MATSVLAIDTGSHSAAAIGAEAPPILASVHLTAGNDPDDHGPRYAQYAEWLADLIAVHQPGVLAFESPLVPRGNNMITNANTVRFLLGLAAITELTGHDAGLRVFEANLQSTKRHFAGTGRADKPAMMARCRQLGWAPKNHNEADAAALWSYAKSILEPGFAYRMTPLLGRAHG